ncbi:MAG: Fic family protein [Bdellovibrionales bacterium]|nr:Fic family protein [Bdellovibrionales bacterium]
MMSKSKNIDITHNRSWTAEQPFQELPTLPPEFDLETKSILKKCISARAALAELKQAAELIPNQSMLIGILPKLEARASSEIENIVTTTDKLFEFEHREEQADPTTKETLRYSRALLKGFMELKDHPLNTRTIEEVCSVIKGVEMKVRKVPGTQLKNSKTEKVIYTPPSGEKLLRDLLENWEKFLHNKTGIDPLIRMAVCHYQFEAIHPFTDGNGRTGRIVNNLFLVQENLLSLPILYLSRYLIQEKESYYQLLLGVTKDNNWENWIIFILSAVEDTSYWTRNKIEAIRKLMDHTKEYIKSTKARKFYSYELLSLIFELPYCRIQDLREKKIAKRQAASKYLKELTQIGVLKELTVGREKLFLHPKLVELLKDETNHFTLYSETYPKNLSELAGLPKSSNRKNVKK